MNGLDVQEAVFITRPKTRDTDGICHDWAVPLRYFDPKEFWPQHQSPTTCVLVQAYKPKRPLVNIIELQPKYEPVEGEITHHPSYKPRNVRLDAGHIRTGRYSTCALRPARRFPGRPGR